jgi:hypothetical protein
MTPAVKDSAQALGSAKPRSRVMIMASVAIAALGWSATEFERRSEHQGSVISIVLIDPTTRPEKHFWADPDDIIDRTGRFV